jgi:hypothetical protein
MDSLGWEIPRDECLLEYLSSSVRWMTSSKLVSFIWGSPYLCWKRSSKRRTERSHRRTTPNILPNVQSITCQLWHALMFRRTLTPFSSGGNVTWPIIFPKITNLGLAHQDLRGYNGLSQILLCVKDRSRVYLSMSHNLRVCPLSFSSLFKQEEVWSN